MLSNGRFIKRSEFLYALEKVYEESSTDYLLALRDGLSVIIAERKNPIHKPYEEHYGGYVKYV